jgi:hypothetical protein
MHSPPALYHRRFFLLWLGRMVSVAWITQRWLQLRHFDGNEAVQA